MIIAESYNCGNVGSPLSEATHQDLTISRSTSNKIQKVKDGRIKHTITFWYAWNGDKFSLFVLVPLTAAPALLRYQTFDLALYAGTVFNLFAGTGTGTVGTGTGTGTRRESVHITICLAYGNLGDLLSESGRDHCSAANRVNSVLY